MENGNTQTKTTTYHYNAHRLDSVSYDDALTTIYHYDQYGRVDSLYDESGVVCYTYGNMGEVTQETRIYALPFLSSPVALSTQFTYDSWGRIQDITYPDNEVVSYTYDLGGQLQSISNNSNYTYLDNVAYDRFGAKVSQTYGNGLVTDYTYENLTRRLSQISVTDNSSNPYGDIQYGYDPVGNVIQANSNCPWYPAQGFMEIFTYDASDQLVSATEMQNQSYSLSVTYGNWGKISSYSLTQTDLQQNVTTSEAQSYTYPAANSIGGSQSLFAPASRSIQKPGQPHSVQNFTFGINGSLRKTEVQMPVSNHNVEYFLFNSAANLKAYSNNGLDFAYYGYNASNTRTYKFSMLNQNQWVNGQPQPLNLQLQSAMFYPNAYINFNQNGEYTKHYYNGAERIASRLGTVTLNIATTANARLDSRSTQVDNRFQSDIHTLVYAEDVSVDYDINIQTTSLQQTGTATDIFYYHTNHLGSTAYVTDQNQNVTQGFLYAPFGEITTEYNANFYSNILPKYSFNAKELDEETGMYYYEARYYKPPVFTSRDPMFEKYFWMTPYAYCANNPVKYVDPSGEAWKPTFNEETGEYTGYQWIDPKYSYNSDGTLKDGLYEQAIFFSENGTYNPESKYNMGSSTATVYKSDGTTETFDACTYPSDASKYATVPAGIYTARRGMHNGRSSSYPALRILDDINLGGPNPNHPDRDYADDVNIHKPGDGNFTGIGKNGLPVSEGCLLIDIKAWNRFLRCFSENTDISVTVSRTMTAPTNVNVRLFHFPIVTPTCPIDNTRVNIPLRL